MENNIKFIGVGRNYDTIFVATYAFDGNGEAYKNEATKILRDQNPIAQTLINLTQKVPTMLGEWSVLCDQDHIFYFLLTRSGYPGRHSTALIEKLKTSFRNQGVEMIKTTPTNSYTNIMKGDVGKL
jgi:hypothetical protein